MKPLVDPPRLLESRDAEMQSLRGALRSLRADLPNDTELDALRARIMPVVVPPPRGGGSAGVGAGIGALASKAKVIAVVSLLAASGAGVGVIAHGHRSAQVVPSPAAAHEAAPIAETTPAALPAPPEPAVSAIEAESPVEPASTTEIAHRTSAARTSAPRQTTSATALPDTGAAADPRAPDRASEVRLLQRAQDALGADPAGALALTAEHARSYAAPLLSQEREVIAIAALVKLGRTAEAHARANAFYARYPISAHRRRVEALVGDAAIEK